MTALSSIGRTGRAGLIRDAADLESTDQAGGEAQLLRQRAEAGAMTTG